MITTSEILKQLQEQGLRKQNEVLNFVRDNYPDFEGIQDAVVRAIVQGEVQVNDNLIWVIQSVQRLFGEKWFEEDLSLILERCKMLGNLSQPALNELEMDIVAQMLEKQKAFYTSGVSSFIVPTLTDVANQQRLDVSDKSTWHYWKKHKRDLEQTFNATHSAEGMRRVQKIDVETDEILKNLRDPREKDENNEFRDFRTLGLVIGHVQSGKTANFMGVISKAASIGYRLIIVLAGTKDDLRTQTQLRFERELCGHDRYQLNRGIANISNWANADTANELGNWRIEGVPTPHYAHAGSFWKYYTPTGNNDSAYEGENFSNLFLVHNCVVLVVKKHALRIQNGGCVEYKGVLGRLISWINNREDQTYLPPTLVIDDEADQAGVNNQPTNDEGSDRSTINGAIRRLVYEVFNVSKNPRAQARQIAFIGYTATPFANVFIDQSVDDIYPRDFILALDRPKRYFGLNQYFGEVTRNFFIDDVSEEAWREELHILHQPIALGLPERLERAIFDFLFYCVVKDFRKIDGEKSMMIHTSWRNHEQGCIHEKVKARLGELVKSNAELEAGINEFWSEFEQRANGVREELVLSYEWPSWNRVELINKCRDVLDKVQLKLVNGPNDNLNYSAENLEYVIVVGGNILSRGLTLEGLAVTYYMRDSRNYDSLLQMARWFGYRVGYEDLIRVYSAEPISAAFEFLLKVEEDLREEIRAYSRMGLTPQDFAPRVLAHQRMMPSGRMGVAREISYSNKVVQTFLLDANVDRLRENHQFSHALVSRLHREREPENVNGKWLYKDVPTEIVQAEFLNKFHFGFVENRGVRSEEIKRFIDRYRNDGLRSFDVLVSSIMDLRAGSIQEELADAIRVNPVVRGNTRVAPTDELVHFGVISQPSDFDFASNRPLLVLYFIDFVNSKYLDEQEQVEKLIFPQVDFNPVAFAICFPNLGHANYFQQLF